MATPTKAEFEALAPAEQVKVIAAITSPEERDSFLREVLSVVPLTTVTELKDKLDKMRTNNVSLLKEKTTLEQKLAKAADPEQVTTLTAELDLLRRELDRGKLEMTLRDAGAKAGVEERAMPDYVRRGLEVFHVVDGQVVAQEGSQTPDDWANALRTDAPHLYKPSRGGGAVPNTGGPPARPMISRDPTEFGKNIEKIASGAVLVSDE